MSNEHIHVIVIHRYTYKTLLLVYQIYILHKPYVLSQTVFKWHLNCTIGSASGKQNTFNQYQYQKGCADCHVYHISLE